MIEFSCSLCGTKLKVADDRSGKSGKCPQCGTIILVPQHDEVGRDEFPGPQAQLQSALAPTPAQQTAHQRIRTAEHPQMIFCSKCGQENLENNYKCTLCGFVLHDTAKPQYVTPDDGTLGGLIPYKNARALWAYYLGVFSLIPCVGIPLGIAALVLGIQGLKFAELHAEVKGKAHAWTGIILGSLTTIGYTVYAVVVIMQARL